MNNDKGFTLVELIVVIAILAVIAGIAAPNLISNINKARRQVDVTNAQAIHEALMTVYAEDEKYIGVDTGLAAAGSVEFTKTSSPAAGSIQEWINHAMDKTQKGSFKTKYKSGGSFYFVASKGFIKIFDKDGVEMWPNTATLYQE